MSSQTATAAATDLPDMMTGREVLAALRIENVKFPSCVLHRLRRSGKLHGVRLGRSYVYRRDDVAKLLGGCRG